MNRYLHTPTEPFAVKPGATASEMLAHMSHTSFQGRNLGVAAEIWVKMLENPTTILFGLAGAMVPAGMRRLMVYLIENRFIDCLVSTGANLFHDLHETMGWHHFQGSAVADDEELRDAGVNRIYDTFALEEEFEKADEVITAFAQYLEHDRPYTTREYFFRLGQYLDRIKKEEGILTSAARTGVPIYCPALADSCYGYALAAARVKKGWPVMIDTIADVIDITDMATSAAASGVIYVGGGTPKNFIQQSMVAGYILDRSPSGHRYAIQITADAPHWGGLSGCTFEEAKSWRKVAKDANMVTVNADATIALPILVSAVAERVSKRKTSDAQR